MLKHGLKSLKHGQSPYALMSKKHTEGHALSYLAYATIASVEFSSTVMAKLVACESLIGCFAYVTFVYQILVSRPCCFSNIDYNLHEQPQHHYRILCE